MCTCRTDRRFLPRASRENVAVARCSAGFSVWPSLTALILTIGACNAPPLEVRFYTPSEEARMEEAMEDSFDDEDYDGRDDETAGASSYVRMEKNSFGMEQPSSGDVGTRAGDFTVFSFEPGKYDFEYAMPGDPERPLFGRVEVCDIDDKQTRKFVRHTFLTIHPEASGDTEGFPWFSSVITDDDVRRVHMGDVVEKVVFVVDQRAVDGRIAKLDEEIRQVQDLESRFNGQLEYWNVKLAERRRNALYSGDYGEDAPSSHLASLQAIAGPESYHWYRYSEADDKVHTYAEQVAQLQLPLRRLREERAALRGIQTSARVIHRRGELMMMTLEMQRPFYDGIEELDEERTGLKGPENVTEDPYLISSTSRNPSYQRWLVTNSGMDSETRRIGEPIMVVKLGPRMPGSL